MSRLVEAEPRMVAGRAADLRGAEETTRGKIKEYGERVAKYIPAEILAFYASAVQLILTKQGPEHASFRFWAFAIAGLLAWAATPAWLGQFTDDPATRRPNQRMGFAAFIVWAYAYPAGLFAELGWYDPVIGGLLLLFFTLLSGFYQPRK